MAMAGPVLEAIDGPVPYTRDLLVQNGIGGINCGSGASLASGCLNVDRLSFTDRQGKSSAPGVLLRIRHEQQILYYMQHDLTQPFPFADRCFAWGYSEHFIEHVTLKEAIGWFGEMRRLIAPGGLLRVTTPDLEKYIHGYADPEEKFFAQHRERLEELQAGETWVTNRRAWMVNQIFRYYGHQWIYDFDEIVHAASVAGFDPAGIARRAFRAGAREDLCMLDSASRSDETLYVELAT